MATTYRNSFLGKAALQVLDITRDEAKTLPTVKQVIKAFSQYAEELTQPLVALAELYTQNVDASLRRDRGEVGALGPSGTQLAARAIAIDNCEYSVRAMKQDIGSSSRFVKAGYDFEPGEMVYQSFIESLVAHRKGTSIEKASQRAWEVSRKGGDAYAYFLGSYTLFQLGRPNSEPLSDFFAHNSLVDHWNIVKYLPEPTRAAFNKGQTCANKPEV